MFPRMEENVPPRRIHCEGRGMSAGTQEHDMNSKRIFAGTVAAAVLAMTSPAYAGHLGGSGGLGGGFGGRLGRPGGSRRVGGAGSLASRGRVNGSLGSNTKPAAKVAGKTADKVDATAASATQESGSVANSAEKTTSSAASSSAASAATTADASKSLNSTLSGNGTLSTS